MPVQIKGVGSISGLDQGIVVGIVTSSTQINVGSNIKFGSAGIATASNFKTGSSNLHSTGLTVGNNFLHSTGINVGTGATIHVPASNTLTFGTNSNERIRITSDGQLKQTAASGDTIFTFKRSDTNTTGAVAVLNFAASDDHSVANIQVLGDGDNEGAHIVFKTTSDAASSDPFNAATVERNYKFKIVVHTLDY